MKSLCLSIKLHDVTSQKGDVSLTQNSQRQNEFATMLSSTGHCCDDNFTLFFRISPKSNVNVNNGFKSYFLLSFPLFSCLYVSSADHSDRAGQGMNSLRSLEHWDRGFESHSRHGCLCAFILCLCCSVCRQRPCDGLIPPPRSPTDSV
jgi:hypothetical protein